MKSVDQIEGSLLRDLDGEFFFRVYSQDKKHHKDYKIRTEDLQIKLLGNYHSIVDKPSALWDGFIEYTSLVDAVLVRENY